MNEVLNQFFTNHPGPFIRMIAHGVKSKGIPYIVRSSIPNDYFGIHNLQKAEELVSVLNAAWSEWKNERTDKGVDSV